MPITSSFNSGTGVLTTTGDDLANTITTGRDASGNILVNGGAVVIAGGPATVANTTSIQVSGQGGDDVITVDESNGALPALTLSGGAGNDSIVGSSGADTIQGDDGNDIVRGGRGNDTALLGADDDTFIWSPGDGSDIVEGGTGTDTLQFSGANVNEKIDISANGGRVLFTRDVASIAMDLNSVEHIVFHALGGTDTVTVHSLVGTGTAEVDVDLAGSGGTSDGQTDNVIVEGTTGNDNVTIAGSGTSAAVVGLSALVTIVAADSIDVLTVNTLDGNDTISAANLFGGIIRLTIDGGLGNDTITGSQGADTLLGNDGDDRIIWTLGGGNDLIEGGVGNDTLEVDGGTGADSIQITANGTRVAVTGTVPAAFTLDVGTIESIVVNAGDGNDTITAGNGIAALVDLIIDGGDGNDTITGGDGNDLISGGNGNDTVVGGRGSDTALMGADDDTFVWNPGDGSDIVEGQAGTDTLMFNGANVAERINISANGSRVLFTRDVGNVVMDLNGIEQISFTARGGADTITVNDLTGTNVTGVSIDLSASGGGGAGDGALDSVIVNGTAGDDSITVTGGPSSASVTGLAAATSVVGGETTDVLTVNGLGGNDTINAAGVALGSLALVIDGGVGNDTITGGQGADTLLGNDGDDRIIWTLGGGNDVAEGGVGNDTLEVDGGAGTDSMSVTANGTRVAVAGTVPAAFNIDAGTFEAVVINAGNGDDTITAGNGLAPLIALTIDGGDGNDTITGGDGADTLIGGNGNDIVTGGRGNDVAFLGADNDTFIWNPGDGSDTVEGQGGSDTLQFNGANVNEVINISANGGRVLFTRDVGNIAMDIDGVEQVVFHALGGADTINVNDLSGTDLVAGSVVIELESANGSGLGDGAVDRVTVNGTASDDFMTVGMVSGHIAVLGSPSPVSIFHAESGDQLRVNGGAGNDTIDASSLPLGQIVLTIDGGTGNDNITGAQGSESLIGGDGDDVLDGAGGADIMAGGIGNDAYIVDTPGDVVVENAGEGNDTVFSLASVTLSANVENLVLQGGADLQGFGNNLANVILGNTGNNLIDGGTGADTMVGGAGNDTYFVDNVGDSIIENVNAGTDTVFSSVNFTLGPNVEVLVLQGPGDLQGFGNDLANTLIGSGGNDLLDGAGGADTMSGGVGNDVYFVDNAGDVVNENANEGSDTIFASINLTLAANVENLVMQGGADLQGFGNTLANSIFGNSGNNLIDGGAGADSMTGGAGNDVYFVDNAGDAVFENANAGNDTVFTTVSFTLASNVENLVMQGAADLQGFGNSDANVIFGNSGNNLIDGHGGVDLAIGGAGNDTYFVDDPSDSCFEAANEGNDTVFASCNYGLAADVETLVMQGSGDFQGYGSNGVNTLFGNSGNNLLNGAGGADTMIGGAGNDTYFVDNTGDVVFENINEGTDVVLAAVNYTLTANVEALVLQGGANLSGTGNALNNSLFGNVGDNTLDGGGGADQLTGNAGNDTFVFHAGEANGDTVVDFAGNGAAAGDSFQFVGYGTAGAGATFTQIGATNQWQIHSAIDAHNEIVTLSNSASVNVLDFSFI